MMTDFIWYCVLYIGASVVCAVFVSLWIKAGTDKPMPGDIEP